jgi:hypothetical protein
MRILVRLAALLLHSRSDEVRTDVGAEQDIRRRRFHRVIVALSLTLLLADTFSTSSEGERRRAGHGGIARFARTLR